MTHTLKRTFAMLLLAVFGSAILYNCEPDPDSLGKQLFDKDAATGNEDLRDVIAYNISNNDSIRSDAARLLIGATDAGSNFAAVLGAFHEDQFGTQKASFITQLRMPVDNFDFSGPKPEVDSVVLVLRTPANTATNTYYIADSLKAPAAYNKDDFMVGNEKVPVSIEKKSYPVRKYGKYVKSMRINVERINTFLSTNDPDLTRSNAPVTTDKLLGSAVFDGNVSSVTVTKRSDNSVLFSGGTGFRMQLDKDFFQQNIVNIKGSNDLKDAASFTRYFRGIKISVADDNGYLFKISPNDTEIIMYYKYDKTDNGVVTRPQTTLKFNMGSINARIGKYEYNRSGSAYQTALGKSNPAEGDQVLFLQGMGGPSIGVKIPDATIEDLKKKFAADKAGILGAKIRIFADKKSTWTKPHFTDVDRRFTLLKTPDANMSWTFTSDFVNGFPIYYYIKTDNNENDYYDFTVTQTLKDIVENKTANNSPIIINAGEFVKNSKGGSFGPLFTTRATEMNRMVFVGTEKSNSDPKRVQLRITYSTKK